jgi:hypothetical protein
MSRLVLKLKDHDGDLQQTSVIGTIGNTGASYDASEGLAYALRDAILDVVLGANAGYQFVADDVDLNPANPADIFAQTNIQWIAQYTDDVNGAVRTTRIGTADLDQATEMFGGAPALDLSAGNGLALKTAFEAYVLNDGHAVTLNAVYFRE